MIAVISTPMGESESLSSCLSPKQQVQRSHLVQYITISSLRNFENMLRIRIFYHYDLKAKNCCVVVRFNLFIVTSCGNLLAVRNEHIID